MATTITKDMLPALLAAIEGLTRQQVLIGIPGDVPDRRPEPGQGAPLTNPTIGFIQEFGSPAANIPARPFLRPGVQQALPACIERLRAGAKRALTLPPNPDAGTNALIAAGLTAQNSVRAYINAGVSPGLAAATLRARRARGRTGATPLIDTGQLRNSIQFVLRNK